MKHFLILTLFLLPVISFGQLYYEINKINADSLDKVLPEMDGNERIDALNIMAMAMSIEAPDSCIQIARRVIQMSQEMDYPKGVADGYFNLGNVYYFQDSLKPCVLNYLSALRIYEQMPPCKWMGVTLGNLALINWLVGRTERAIEYKRQQFKVYEQLDLPLSEKWGSVILIAYYLDGIEKYDSIDYYCQKAFELADEHKDTAFAAYTYTNLFRFKLHQAMADPALRDSMDQIISLGLKAYELRDHLDMSRTGYTIWHMFMFTHLANAYFEKRTETSVEKGLEYLNKAKRIYDTITFPYSDVIRIFRFFAYSRSMSGDYAGAIKYYEKGLEEYQKNISSSEAEFKHEKILWDYLDKKALQAVYDSLCRNYKKLGNFRKALEYNIMQEKMKDDIFLTDQTNMVAILEADSENEKVVKQLDLLERERQIKELKFNQARNINITIGILFLVFVLFMVLFVRQIKLKNEYKSSILKQKLLRLQMNPHFLFNALTSIHNLVLRDNRQKASDYLVNFAKLLRGSLESTREDFVSVDDEINMINNYLEIQRLRHDNKFDFAVEVDHNIDLDNAIIPPMIIQPFIENAIEHGLVNKAENGHIQVLFTLDNNRLICEIDDDGVGRGNGTNLKVQMGKRRSLATEIIQERIHILNKKLKQKIKLEITDKRSKENKALGTRVRIILPYMLD